MDNKKYIFDKDKESIFPHSQDVIERNTSDGAFSSGWGMHFMPVERYWLDVHTHIEEKNPVKLRSIISDYLSKTGTRNVKSMAVILPMLDEMTHKSENPCIQNSDDLKNYISLLNKNENQFLMLYMDYKSPDVKLLEEAVRLGIRGIKLHNAGMIIEGGDHNIWLSKEWKAVFKAIEKHKLPVLWHVTQRLTDSPYVGGGRNSYWEEGWKKGIKYTNEDLLQVYLKVVEEFPGISFISAHQLHLGWDRLSALFEQHNNLFTDTSVGCFVRNHDEIYDTDREYLRNIFLKYNDRILFATDIIIREDRMEGCNDLYDGHIRFIRQLRLPDYVLQKISHENAERIFMVAVTSS